MVVTWLHGMLVMEFYVLVVPYGSPLQLLSFIFHLTSTGIVHKSSLSSTMKSVRMWKNCQSYTHHIQGTLHLKTLQLYARITFSCMHPPYAVCNRIHR